MADWTKFGILNDLVQEAAKTLGDDPEDISVSMWEEVFPSTTGPRSGIGGCMMTSYTVFGFRGSVHSIMFCSGTWKKWNGIDTAWNWKFTEARKVAEQEKAERQHSRKSVADETAQKLIQSAYVEGYFSSVGLSEEAAVERQEVHWDRSNSKKDLTALTEGRLEDIVLVDIRRMGIPDA